LKSHHVVKRVEEARTRFAYLADFNLESQTMIGDTRTKRGDSNGSRTECSGTQAGVQLRRLGPSEAAKEYWNLIRRIPLRPAQSAKNAPSNPSSVAKRRPIGTNYDSHDSNRLVLALFSLFSSEFHQALEEIVRHATHVADFSAVDE